MSKEPFTNEEIFGVAFDGSLSDFNYISKIIDVREVRDNQGQTILHRITLGWERRVKHLMLEKVLCLEVKDIINIQDYNGNTALFYAVRSRDHFAIKKLLDKGALVNIKNNRNETILSFAISLFRNDSDLEMLEIVEELKKAHGKHQTSERAVLTRVLLGDDSPFGYINDAHKNNHIIIAQNILPNNPNGNTDIGNRDIATNIASFVY